MNEKSNNTWSKTKCLLFGLACLVMLIALFYAEEDWRGWHAWQKFKHKWQAKGERFDRASVIPQPVPEDQNFALSPIVFTSYGSMLTRDGKMIPVKDRDTHFVNRLDMPTGHGNDDLSKGLGNWEQNRMSDLRFLQEYYRTLAANTNQFLVLPEPQTPAADVLLALGKYDPAIEELRQASQLPYARYPLNYASENPGAILLPHLASLKGCASVLRVRSIAELQNGQSDKALADVKLALQLTDKIRSEPLLISTWFALRCCESSSSRFGKVWRSTNGRTHNSPNLTGNSPDWIFFPTTNWPCVVNWCCSRAALLIICDATRRNFPIYSGERHSPPPAPIRILCHLIPGGWFYQNQFRCARSLVEQSLPMVDLEQRVVSPAATRRAGAAFDLEFRHASPYNFLERMLLPGLGAALRKFAYGQESVDLARVAIALERYRLAHGAYPESLDALAPQFMEIIPHDLINGQPLHYRREADGQFTLYSVGWNETDDDGEVVLGKNGAPDISTGDWVWQYPAK